MAAADNRIVPKKKETTGEPRSPMGRSRKTAAADNGSNVSAVGKSLKLSVASATNLQRAGVKVSQAF